MGLSAGTGSPVWFMCPKLRRIYPRDYHDRDMHRVKRTGRWKRRVPKGALGVRSLLHAWEYVCSCGHKGWTNHVEILRYAMVDGSEKPETCSWYHCGAPKGQCTHKREASA
jgi:hypothetical protein